jgi:hypothetical protein
MNFNHPVKELIWVVQRDAVTRPNINQWTNYTDDFDVDLLWRNWNDDSPPTCLQALNTNVEAGYMGKSFPFVANSLYSNNNPNVTDRTSPEIASLFGSMAGVNFPGGGIGPGSFALSDAPVDFASNDEAGGGADHALVPYYAGRNPVIRAKIQLNGHDRFQERLGSYFNLVQPYQHHTNVPATGINVYSFALTPELHQPSGSLNFSRIDSAVLQLQLTQKAAKGSKIRVYAINYNVLRIMSGMGGLGLMLVQKSMMSIMLVINYITKHLVAGNSVNIYTCGQSAGEDLIGPAPTTERMLGLVY